jgi:hypothetical protein
MLQSIQSPLTSNADKHTVTPLQPDLAKFNMEKLDADMVGLMKKRVHDMAGCTPGVKVTIINSICFYNARVCALNWLANDKLFGRA